MVAIRDRVDKVLVLPGVRAFGDSKGLPMRLFTERRGAHVGDPYLDGSQPLAAKPFAMGANLLARGSGSIGA
jgi:hypothetical protein